MDKYIKNGVGLINTDNAAYSSAKKRKKQRQKLQKLFSEFEELKLRVAALEKSDK